MANKKHLEILKQGVEVWNQWVKENLISEADLRKADLRGADLIRVNLSMANLNGANFDEANLRGANLQMANLMKANLRKANLSNADLSATILRGVDLSGANLSFVQALEADFEGAILTGACLGDWHINKATNLNNIICDYIYLKENQQERRPLNPNKNFAPGEFTHLSQKALETADLIFRDDIDWKVFLSVFGKLQIEEEGNKLSIQAIEKRYDGTLIIRVNIPSESDKTLILKVFQENYLKALEAIKAKYQAELEAKEEQITLYKEQNARMREMLRSLANRPLTIDIHPISNRPQD
jgi:uncharacterized protein YjbI with pentapeptide repeats